MKKTLLLLAIAAMITSCGGGKGEKKEGGDVKATEENNAEATDLSKNPDYQKGLALVAKAENLCLTCHKIDEKLTGPAYRDVANKYENTPENVKSLAEKIIKGGSGVWGEVAMTPNSKISQEDAEVMVRYILLLKK